MGVLKSIKDTFGKEAALLVVPIVCPLDYDENKTAKIKENGWKRRDVSTFSLHGPVFVYRYEHPVHGTELEMTGKNIGAIDREVREELLMQYI